MLSRVPGSRHSKMVVLFVAVRPAFGQSTSPQQDPGKTIQFLTDAVKFIFSWVILMPIGVIVSGKFLSKRIPLAGVGSQILTITLPFGQFILVQATGSEVI